LGDGLFLKRVNKKTVTNPGNGFFIWGKAKEGGK
jgi:hypothetical protein